MKLAIIILTWNGLELTKRCLDSLNLDNLAEQTQVIVVDNASTDGTLAYLRSLPKITLIENQANLGYGRAVNLGIQSADSQANIILLNNDVQLIEANWLDKLLDQAIKNPSHHIIGVKILQENGRLQHCGAYLPTDTYWGQQLGAGEEDIGQYSGITPSESVVFACVYIQSTVFNKIGLLDEDFFAYFEDTDFCLRAKKSGFNIMVNGNIRVLHSENSSTKVNKVSHSKIFLKSQTTFKKKWAQTLEQERYPHGSVDFHSIINFPSGYAGSAKTFIESLDRQGVKVAYQYVYGPGTVFPVKEPRYSDSYIANMASARKFGQADIQVVYAQGDAFSRNTGKTKVGFTMLEVTGLPAEWVKQANQMDEVWVPSAFNRATFENSGVTRPISVIPLGVDPDYFSPEITGWKVPDIYTFLSVFEWGERKAPEILLQAFSDEFSSHEDVVLICKTNNFDPSINLQEQISKLRLRSNGGRIVIAENRILQPYELGTLYRSADCFVLPTRGEGWGMPILEAMACGIPVIATNWSAQTEFMTEQNSLPLAVEQLIPAIAKCPYYEGFQWAQPSYEHLRSLMRWVFEHPKNAYELGQAAAIDVRDKWTWENATRKMIGRLECLD